MFVRIRWASALKLPFPIRWFNENILLFSNKAIQNWHHESEKNRVQCERENSMGDVSLSTTFPCFLREIAPILLWFFCILLLFIFSLPLYPFRSRCLVYSTSQLTALEKWAKERIKHRHRRKLLQLLLSLQRTISSLLCASPCFFFRLIFLFSFCLYVQTDDSFARADPGRPIPQVPPLPNPALLKVDPSIFVDAIGQRYNALIEAAPHLSLFFLSSPSLPNFLVSCTSLQGY
jgi:hypothetical protein